LDNDLEIVPVLNKIDLPAADPDRVKADIEDTIGLDASDAVLSSAKEGIGIRDILEAVVHKVPPPKGNIDAPLKALVFDSWFDAYRGVINMIRVVDGELKRGQKIKWMASGATSEVLELGVYAPFASPVDTL